ncbi:6-bladed beta-propeller [Belliella pelovolcani]|uniref:6-bladed beta-propeller protein n=1 Tax=Belliella pelovolcani TaxID=529505 RepID=A0A1N7PWN3_9BACT|nr:6-bladed beta-propeller [Belliella pelovolcani]SIT15001.1 6-bladed beta-propeller protein [Belliella pelovolcani]
MMNVYYKRISRAIIGLSLALCMGCTSQDQSEEVNEKDGVITIKVDLESVKDGKLTDFFEPEIEYLLLQEGDNPEAQIGEIAKLVGYNDMIFIFDWWIGKSVQIFDRQGNFLSRIRNYGEGPEKYLELADIDIAQDTIYLLAYPQKIMKFDLDGNFLSEFKIEVTGRTFHYDSTTSTFFVYNGTRSDYLVNTIDHHGKIIGSHFPLNQNIYNGIMSDKYNFFKEDDGLYFTKSYLDTLYKYDNGVFKPRLIFDYGELKMDHQKMLEKEKSMDSREFFDYFRANSGLSFSPFGFSNSRYLMTRLSYSEKGYTSVFDKKNKAHQLINFNLINDIDGSFDFYPPVHQLEGTEVAIAFRGTSLYNKAVEKKQTMSDEDWKAYQAGKGKDFIEAAFYGKETENYVLMILKTKK